MITTIGDIETHSKIIQNQIIITNDGIVDMLLPWTITIRIINNKLNFNLKKSDPVKEIEIKEVIIIDEIWDSENKDLAIYGLMIDIFSNDPNYNIMIPPGVDFKSKSIISRSITRKIMENKIIYTITDKNNKEINIIGLIE